MMTNMHGPGANYQYGHPGMYGSGGPIAGPSMIHKGFVRGQRQRLNVVPILICLFVPWILFCLMYWAMSFSLHYKNRFICYFLVLVGLAFVGIIGMLARNAVKKKKEESGQLLVGGEGTTSHEPTWLIFLFLTCLLAWIVGVVGGDINFFNHMEPYYDVTNLNKYTDVDVRYWRGQQLMDAGRIMFKEGTKLDLQRSMGFKNLEMYCVAPIVDAQAAAPTATSDALLPTYDFWAVGMNCCSGIVKHGDFHCGEFNNARAMAGLRLMRDDQRAFFRLAVQQAEAAFTIRADHPLFFHWMEDPIAEVNAYKDEGYKYYLLGIFSYFLLQLFLVIVACLAFSKLGRLV